MGTIQQGKSVIINALEITNKAVNVHYIKNYIIFDNILSHYVN